MSRSHFFTGVPIIAVLLLGLQGWSAEPGALPKVLPGSAPAKPEAPGAEAKPSPTAAKPATGPEAIRQKHPDFYLNVGVDRADRCYEEGDSLTLSVTFEARAEKAYLHVVYRQADGKVYQIFPNAGRRDNLIQGGQTWRFPLKDDLFRWIVGPPFGKETIKVIASKKPLGRLSEADLRKVKFNPVSEKDVETTRTELETQKEAWSENQVEITTYARGKAPAGSRGRRFGVFFGVGRYEFDDVQSEYVEHMVNAAAEKARKEGREFKRPRIDKLYRPAHKNNATRMEEVFRKLGRLNDSRVYVEREATRENMEKSIEWLREVTQDGRGDTVFIYISSHGGREPGNPEKDRTILGPGEKPTFFLLPHDHADFEVLEALSRQRQLGKLSPALMDRHKQMLRTAFPDGVPNPLDEPAIRAANLRLLKEYCVTADDFGGWVSTLSGRQVVVMMATCHSGGFATREPEVDKGTDEVQDFAINFLAPQLGRLKDIGQPESALLVACQARESSLSTAFFEEDLRRALRTGVPPDRYLQLGLASYLLLQGMEGLPAPLAMDQEFEKWYQQRTKGYCQLLYQMQKRVAEEAQKKRPAGDQGEPPKEFQCHPRLFNYCSRPIVLKP
jgi:hypothetical protein